VPSCTVVVSPDVAFTAARTFFWRKWRSPFGLVHIGSFVLVTAMLVTFVTWTGADSFAVGFLSLILMMNVILESGYFFGLPRGFRRAVEHSTDRTSEIETTSDGFTVRSGQTSRQFPWHAFAAVWIYPDVILLPLGKVVFLNCFIWIPTAGMTAEVLADFRAVQERRASGVSTSA
jgi:hypothetical protein